MYINIDSHICALECKMADVAYKYVCAIKYGDWGEQKCLFEKLKVMKQRLFILKTMKRGYCTCIEFCDIDKILEEYGL